MRSKDEKKKGVKLGKYGPPLEPAKLPEPEPLSLKKLLLKRVEKASD